MGGADVYVKGSIRDFREAAISLVAKAPPFKIETLAAEHRRLAERLQQYGDCRDAPEIWRKAGLPGPDRITELPDDVFLAVPRLEEAGHEAR